MQQLHYAGRRPVRRTLVDLADAVLTMAGDLATNLDARATGAAGRPLRRPAAEARGHGQPPCNRMAAAVQPDLGQDLPADIMGL